jgi:NAD(P)-dependent dehydrogenase (short-subunit alcohol dehydrogenase family)
MGRVALVSGASRGLGAVIAERLAADGMRVAVNYVAGTEPDAAAVAERIGGTAVEADVTDQAAVTRLVATVERDLGPVEVLVCNATGPQPGIPFEELTWDDLLDQLAFFARSPLLLTQAVLPGMKAAGWGRIVHVGSDITDRVPPDLAAYVTGKAAQLGLAGATAQHVARWGITVNTVAPGWIPVERHAGADTTGYAAHLPGGRLGTPAEVAAVVSFLASDGASFVTGERIRADGGHGRV